MKELTILNQPPSETISMATIEMFDSFKTELTADLEKYQGIVYKEEDMEQMAEDKAKLNNYNKKLASKKSDIKAIYLEQFEPIDGQFKMLKGLIDGAVKGIKSQADDFEDTRKKQKYEDVDKIFNTLVGLEMEEYEGFFIPVLHWFWKDAWYKKGETLKKVEEQLNEILANFKNALMLVLIGDIMVPQSHRKYFYRILGHCEGNVGDSIELFNKIFSR